jgi:hypothetical protein
MVLKAKMPPVEVAFFVLAHRLLWTERCNGHLFLPLEGERLDYRTYELVSANSIFL